MRELFPDRLYVELQRHGLDAERASSRGSSSSPIGWALPLVATNEPYFAARSDYEAHDALLCIAEGRCCRRRTERRRCQREHCFKTRADMLALFADLPEATDNSVEIALRCAFRPSRPASRSCRAFTALGRRAARRGGELRRQAASRPATARRRAWPARRAVTDEAYRPAARLRARRHRQDEIPRLFPDRRRLHPMGEGARAFRSGRGAARAPARWSPMR